MRGLVYQAESLEDLLWKVMVMSEYSPGKRNSTVKSSTFTSLALLLLTVFIMILSSARLDNTRFEEVSGSIRGALGLGRLSQGGRSASIGDEMVPMGFNQEIILVQLIEKIRIALVDQMGNGEAEVVESGRGFVVRLPVDFLFQPASLKLRDQVMPTLKQVGTLLAGVKNGIIVSGHTDNAPPPSGLPFASNWGYSAGLAAAVVQFFAEDGGVDPARLVAQGLGHHTPKETNDTDAGRAANRRIEIVVSRTTQPVVTEEKSVETPKENPPQGGDAAASGPSGIVP